MSSVLYVTTTAPSVLSNSCSFEVLQKEQRSDYDDKCLDPPCFVEKGLFIGSVEAEKCLAALREAEITHILQVGGELTPTFPDNFVYKRIQVSDEEKEDMIACFSEAFEFIEEGRQAGAVFVHCAQGMSRSGTVVIGYMMWKERLTYNAALAAVQANRSVVEPNRGFALQLQEFERDGWKLEKWGGWGEEPMERAFRRSSTSGRKVVHHFSEVVRRFHMHSITDDDLVYNEHDTVLDL